MVTSRYPTVNVKMLTWYVIVMVRCIYHLDSQDKERYNLCPINIMSVNAISTIFWYCVLDTSHINWLQTVIKAIFAAIIGRTECNKIRAPF